MNRAIHAGLLLTAAVSAIGLSNAAHAGLKPGGKVEDFRLLDSAGASHQLYYLSDKKAVALIAHGANCAANQRDLPQLQKLRAQYQGQDVAFMMIDSNLGQTRDKIAAAAQKRSVDFPILMDPLQLIGESLDLRQNGEVLIVDPKTWSLAYRGDAAHAADALAAVVKGDAVPAASTPVKGCGIKMPEQARRSAHAKISYEKTIAPMLLDNCVTCHRKGGIGPWQMTSYELVKGFSPMIREVLRTQRMPPWHADPHYGVFKNDRALSTDNVKTLVHWIEAGSPRGEGADPLAAMQKEWPDWALGKPDVVLELPPFDVPSTGVIAYQDIRVKNPIGRDVWLKAIDYAPGDRAVVHHILGYTLTPQQAAARPAGEENGTAAEQPGQQSPQARQLQQACSTPEGAQRIRSRVSGGASGGLSIGGYVPGSAPLKMPDDSGVLLTKDSTFRFQLHYTTSGKPARDVTRVGLYFSTEPPKSVFRMMVLLDPCLTIPANNKAYTASMSRIIDRDMDVYNLTPHSHYRGVASDFIAEYPDGTKETLLSVPKYDFNWQTTYSFATPKRLPKGTRLTHSTTYDNSALNKANPDPSIVVHWGEQSWEEMLYGAVSYRYVDEVAEAPKTTQLIGQ